MLQATKETANASTLIIVAKTTSDICAAGKAHALKGETGQTSMIGNDQCVREDILHVHIIKNRKQWPCVSEAGTARRVADRQADILSPLYIAPASAGL